MSSDNERSGPTGDDELSLPKATVMKLINEMMPSDIVCSKEARDLLIDSCVEFIHLIASESNEIADRETKKTIAGEHVISALKELGFEDYVEDVEEVYKEHRQQQKDRDKRSSRLEKTGISEEELLRQQELLFEQSRLKFEAHH
ncbi:histone-fold-containing protein [Zychaea mexicana]|uniref:histone-fold-containing protein n=1 Tax=Zychaea mexicana TaxID=64656 RepID=UPI0022FEF1D1|nr:histone-fold-containing protein [Zychaea mexicana]KAI9489032.1 histone-fold-containing protein [Zychaea mexicana]